MKNIDLFLETLIFRSRWILAPFYLGLVLAIVALLVKFIKELVYLIFHIFGMGSDQGRSGWARSAFTTSSSS